jgi:hypothetical protein
MSIMKELSVEPTKPGITEQSEPAYPAARAVAAVAEAHFARHIAAAQHEGQIELAPLIDAEAIEAIVDAAFWASLRREEGYSPKISLAFLPPQLAPWPLRFEHPLSLNPVTLAHLAPAVERPGIHLGVWRESGETFVWGTTRSIPTLCFVLEVIQPGLLVIKYRPDQDPGKFVNVAVLEGDRIKVVDEEGARMPDCPSLLTSLLDFGSHVPGDDSNDVLVQIAVSMRAHGRGGALLVVPQSSEEWRESIAGPVNYSVSPPFSKLSELMGKHAEKRRTPAWQEALETAVDTIGGLTAVDGAAIITDKYELLAFGAKIVRRKGGAQVEQVVTTEPILGSAPSIVNPVQLGGTRHLSAAQFVQDQKDSLALVASQDGRFTLFSWSPCEAMVHAHRVEALLL